jgi:protein YIPF1/2
MSKNPSGFGDVSNPFGEIDADLQDYVPPALGAWERQEQPAAAPQSDDPFNTTTQEDDEPFTAAHLAAAAQGAVPAVNPSGSGGLNAPAPSLDFTTSVAPSRDMSGKIGGPVQGSNNVPSLPRVGGPSAVPDTTRLLGQGVQFSAPVGGSNGGRRASSPPDLPTEDPSSFPFYSIKRYRTYFNVDTDEVLSRIFRAVALFFKGDFIDHVGGNPDLYGPFWIASTLVFISAASGNLASYIHFRKFGGGGGAVPPAPPGTDDGHSSGWYYDVDKVGGSMGLFYGYVGVVGMALYMVLRWGFKASVSLAQIWCLYGYCLASFIPMAALCVLPMEAVRWSLVGAATAISAVFLVLNFRSLVVDAAGAKAVPVLLMMVGLHAALGLALKLYFFHYSS